MPNTNDILKLLNIHDKNIYVDENCLNKEIIKGVECNVIDSTLTYTTPDMCPVCGSVNDNTIIKHGHKHSKVLIGNSINIPTYLNLNKQRYLCKSCNTTFTAFTEVVDKNCFISTQTKIKIVLDAKEKKSEKDISKDNFVSSTTVGNIIESLYPCISINTNSLPRNLSFDEFKSVKNVSGKMSFIVIDNDTGGILNILPDRRLNELTSYFYRYSKEERSKVKTISMDMYTPYITLVNKLFPNANIVTDRFHIVQLISKALNKTRIELMKKNKDNYNKLKRYWKLILKREDELDCDTYRYFTCYKGLHCESTIVTSLIELDETFYNTYNIYQRLLKAVKKKDKQLFFRVISEAPDNISEHMIKSLNTFKKMYDYISNALTFDYSNGKIEGTNNLIKTIKRISFGYRSFIKLKVRILLISNSLVTFNISKSRCLTTPT